MEKKKKLIDFVGFSPFLSNLSTNSRHFKKYPKSHHFWEIPPKPFNFTNSSGTPGVFYWIIIPPTITVIQHSLPAHSIDRKNPIDPARRPPSTTRAASAARQASTTASQDFFFFFHKILLLSNAIFFYISPSYYSLVNIFLRINSFIPFSDTICRQTEKQ